MSAPRLSPGMIAVAMSFEPAAVFAMLWIKLGYEVPKSPRVVHVSAMSQLMNNNVVDNLGGKMY